MPFLPDEPTVTGGRFLDDAPPAPAGGRWLDEPETAGTLGGIANSFQRGRLAGQRAIEAIQFTPEGATPRQHRRAFVGAMEDPNYLPRLMEAQDDPAALGRIESLYGPGRRVDAVTDPKRQQNIATAGNVAGLSRDINALPPGAALQEWAKADNSNWWKILAGNGGRNFLEIGANIIAESLPQASASITAGMAGGAAGGPVGAGVGAGTGSFAVEAANSLLEGAQRAGVDLTNPEQVRAFFTDETKIKAARQFAMQRGFPIALFDALTAGVAGKFLKPALGQGMARVAGASGLELGTQMAGGAAGEAAAQVTSGQPLSARDIAAEAIGELVTAPGEVASNLRTEAKGAPAEGGIAGGHFIDEPGSVTKRAGSATSLQPSPKPADVSPDALASLQASLRGESPESPRLKGAVIPKAPEVVPAAQDPSVSARTPSVGLTEEQRAAVEFQRKTDAAVQHFVENPDKDYSGLSRLELELLDGMGDARAKAEMFRRRSAPKQENDDLPYDVIKPVPESAEARRVRQAQEEAELESQAMQVPKPRESYAGTLNPSAGESLIVAAREAGGVNAPPLEDALQRMEAGEAPAKIVAEWARGGGEADALASVLEQIGEAARRGRQFAEFKDLAAAYRKAFTESTRNKTDLTLSGLNDAREMGLPVKVPESTNELIDSVWSEATASRQPELSPQEAALHFNDVLASNRGRTKEQNGGTPVDTGSLVVGDTFAVHGVQMRVAGIDADTDAVTLEPVGGQNAEQFGQRPVIDPQQAPRIYPDFGTYRKGAPVKENSKGPDKVESALDKLKIETPPGSLHAFGLLPEMWNGLIEAVRLAYRGGKSIAAAIEDGLAWLKATHGDQQFDETAVRAELKDIVAGPGLRSQLNNLGAEMAEIEGRGEPIPQDMLDRYKDLADTLGDEIRQGKASAGAGRQRAGSQGVRSDVDRNIQPGRAPAAAAPYTSRESQQQRPTIPQFRGPERLPRGRMRDLFTGLKAWRERVGNWLARRESRMDVTVGRDAADNRAAQVANEASMHVRLKLNRAFDTAPAQVRVKHELREAALTFVVEADGDKGKLSEFWDTIANSDHADTKAGRQALAALQYAETHWDKLQPAAAEYRTLTETEREAELNEGVNSHEWRGGYVYHRWDKESPSAGADPTQPRPAGTPFRKSRSVATYAEGIAQGRKPQTLNALELLAERVASGQRRMNELSWVHGLRNMIDPVTDEPVVVDVIRKARRPVGLPTPSGRAEPSPEEQASPEGYKPEFQSVAPEGYNIFRFGDLEVAVQEGFGKLMTALTAPSYFKGVPAKKVFGFVKSALLLFDTFHLGRMVAWRQMFGLGGGYQKGQTLLDFTPADIREMADRGEIPAAWTEGLLENKRRLALGIRSGFNIGSVLDNSWGDALHHLPGIGTFNKWLFGQYQRGAMAEAWLIEFERMSKALPKLTEAQVARRVSRDLNSRFGNLNRQGLFKSRTAQDLMRFLFLAPQWNESLIRSELGAIGQALKMPLESVQQRRIVAGTLMRATGLMAVGTFLANQILNYAFRGKPTWENEEEGFDKKISAYIPDAIGNGPGFFLNPLALPAEYTHLIEGNLHRSGGDWSEAFLRIFNSRLHSISRAGSIFVSRRDVLGQKLRDGEVLPAMAKAMIPVPIAVPSVASGAKELITGEPSESYPGQYQKQIMASFGVKTDQAPNAEQRIRNLARAFNDTKGIVPHAEFFAGDFDDFTKALRMGNQTAAREALEELLKKKTARQVYDHYKRWAAAPFTGQRGRESEFWRGLSAEQRTKYQAAREARRKLALEAAQLLRAGARP